MSVWYTYGIANLMFDIKTLKTVEYRGCNMYIRNFGNVFESLVVIDGKLYANHIVVTRTFFQILTGKTYTEQQLTDTTKYLLNISEAVVDTVLEGSTKK